MSPPRASVLQPGYQTLQAGEDRSLADASARLPLSPPAAIGSPGSRRPKALMGEIGGSAGRIRTCDQSVNSRPLYH